jgi:hypothetical protein
VSATYPTLGAFNQGELPTIAYRSATKKKQFAREDRRGHRSEQRAKQKLKPTAAKLMTHVTLAEATALAA